MPFALLFMGAIFIIAAFKGRQDELFSLFKSDFTGGGNFFYWVIALVVIVAVGNVKTLRPVSNAFLGLVILVIILTNGRQGLFANFLSQVRNGTSGSNGDGPLDITAHGLSAKDLAGKTAQELGIKFF